MQSASETFKQSTDTHMLGVITVQWKYFIAVEQPLNGRTDARVHMHTTSKVMDLLEELILDLFLKSPPISAIQKMRERMSFDILYSISMELISLPPPPTSMNLMNAA